MKFFSKPIGTTAPLAGIASKTLQQTEVASVSRRRTALISASLPNHLGGATACSSDLTEKQLIIRAPDSKEVKSLYPTGTVLQGTLNYIFVFSDQNGHLYTWRRPKSQPKILPQIHKDLLGTGFLTNGGSYKFRTIKEQANFMEKARQSNLSSLVPIYADEFGLLSPFIEGTPYDKYLLSGGITATKNVLDNIILSHRQNVVYGDRWTKNTIVKPNEAIVEIDFDIELMGEFAQEFEMAQLLYHILFFSSRRSEMLGFLRAYFENRQTDLAQYKIPVVKKFLSNYANYFQDKPFAGISGVQPEIAELIRILSCCFGDED